MESGVVRSVPVALPVLPGKRSPAWTTPRAPESPLASGKLRRRIPGARSLRVSGAKATRPPGSRPQEFGLPFPSSSGSPFVSETTQRSLKDRSSSTGSLS